MFRRCAALHFAVAVAVAAAGGLPLACAPAADPTLDGVVLIVLDTLRADGLSVYGNPRPTSPRIDALAARSVVFEQVVSGGVSTLPGFAALLSSRFPSKKTTGGHLETSLVQEVRAAGFRTAAFTEGGFVSRYFGMDRGFEEFVEQEGALSLQVGSVDINPGGGGVEHTFESASQWLRTNAAERFFLLVHTYEVHTPYRRRAWAQDLEPGRLGETFEVADAGRAASGVQAFEAAELDYIRALYDGGIASADREVGRLLDSLAELGVTERTLVVLTSDHGEELGERTPPRPGNHGHTLYDELLLVPLIVHDPRPGAAAGHVSAQVRSVDVMPTILDLLGIPVPDALDGRSLVALMREGRGEPRPAYARIQKRRVGVAHEMVREGSHKLIRNAYPITPPLELYDLASDPGELNNLAEAEPERRARLAALLDAVRPPPDSGLEAETTEAAPQALQERLRALGYVER